MYGENSASFPPEIDDNDKIGEFYHCFRTFRCTLDTQALNQGVKGEDIDIINRWTKKEKARSRAMSGPMKQNYADFDLLIKPFKPYGEKM